MYIKESDIRDRAILNGMDEYPAWSQREAARQMLDEAETELEQEHIWHVYEVWQEAVDALKELEEPKAEEIAWFLMKGWNDVDECVWASGEFFYNEWQITERDDQWFFEHTQLDGGDFFDVDFLNGLQVCEDHDNTLREQQRLLVRSAKLNPVAMIKLEKLVHRAFRDGLDGGLMVAQNIVDERELRAVK